MSDSQMGDEIGRDSSVSDDILKGENTDGGSKPKLKSGSILKYAGILVMAVALLFFANLAARTAFTERYPNIPGGSAGNTFVDGRATPVGAAAQGAGAGDQCGGTCCTDGGTGQAAAGNGPEAGAGETNSSGDNPVPEQLTETARIEKAAIAWYASKFGDTGVTAVVEDFGCHQQVTIKKGDKVLKELSYRGGEFEALQ